MPVNVGAELARPGAIGPYEHWTIDGNAGNVGAELARPVAWDVWSVLHLPQTDFPALLAQQFAQERTMTPRGVLAVTAD